VYDAQVSRELISKVTDAANEELAERRNGDGSVRAQRGKGPV
jgi:hypothetical protein